MVPSALRIAATAPLAAAVTLFAFPVLDSGAAPARPDGTPSLTPLVRLASPKPRPRGYTVARIRAGRSVKLRSKPGGRTVAKLGARTEFGSKRMLAVAAVRGRWLGVSVPERPNGKLGWIDGRSGAIDRSRVKVSLRADLSARRVDLLVAGRVVDRMKVAIGRPGSPTPIGRFAVTDKLSGGRFGAYYGCCILALSGHQPNTPAGWKGGNRLAIHGTNAPSTIGVPASAGCLRGSDRDLRTLMRRVPVGTKLFIRR
jgi:hypothetical protein